MPTNPLFFEHLPQRPAKPRTTGLTMVRDDGQPLSEIQAILDSYGHLFDYMKFRQFVTWYMRPTELQEKIAACTRADVKTFLGGTVLEVAHLHNKTEYALEVMKEYGLSAVEVSNSMVPLSTEQLSKVVVLARNAGFEVLYEYGKKFQEEAFDVTGAIADIRALLDAGASRIIVEQWQLDATLGVDGKADTAHRMTELAEGVGLEFLVFEAATLPHQVWLLRNLGPEVNLGPNMDPFHVPAKIEPFRHGIGSEVGYNIFEQVLGRTGADVASLLS
jgi:phosphosulfolactate synthase